MSNNPSILPYQRLDKYIKKCHCCGYYSAETKQYEMQEKIVRLCPDCKTYLGDHIKESTHA